MVTQELIIPFYCNYCQNIAYLLKTADQEELQFLDYFDSSFRQHQCFNIQGKSFLEDPQLKKLIALEWGIQKIPFSLKKSQKGKQNRFSMGIIISIPAKDEKDRFLDVLSIENSLIRVRIPSVPDELSAGMLIDLSDANRIGSGKFRIKEIRQVPLTKDIDQSQPQAKEYFQLSLSAYDQEQLEVFINRFSKNLVNQQSPPCSIIPMRISNTGQKTQHIRQVTINSEVDMMKKIKSLNIPEFIQISIKQLLI